MSFLESSTLNDRVPKDKLTQQTQPKKGKPVTVPVPKRSEFDKLIEKAEKPRPNREKG